MVRPVVLATASLIPPHITVIAVAIIITAVFLTAVMELIDYVKDHTHEVEEGCACCSGDHVPATYIRTHNIGGCSFGGAVEGGSK